MKKVALLLLAVAAGLGPTVMIVGAAVGVVGLLALGAAEACGSGGAAQPVEGVALDVEQLANAQTIIATVRALSEAQDVGLAAQDGPRAAVVAIATVMQESRGRNLDYGDRDSIGLFQQRVSIYGRNVAADPVRATSAFVARLVRVPDWQTRPLTEAAQAVQRSAFPDAYAQWEGLAQQLVARLWPGADLSCTVGGIVDGAADGEAGGGPAPTRFALPTVPAQATVVRFALAQVGKPYKYGAEGPDAYDCSGLTMAAWATVGVALPRTTSGQVNTGVWIVGPTYLEPGDLIFTPGSNGTLDNPRHVGLYIGTGEDGQRYLVQAPKSGDVVKVTPVSSWRTIVMIRRPVLPGAG